MPSPQPGTKGSISVNLKNLTVQWLGTGPSQKHALSWGLMCQERRDKLKVNWKQVKGLAQVACILVCRSVSAKAIRPCVPQGGRNGQGELRGGFTPGTQNLLPAARLQEALM